MTEQNDHVQHLVELLRGEVERLGGCGAEVWAVSYLGRHVQATTDAELREAGEALRDMLTALATVQSEVPPLHGRMTTMTQISSERISEILAALNAHDQTPDRADANIWEDVIAGLPEYDRDATDAVDKSDNTVLVLTNGTVIAYTRDVSYGGSMGSSHAAGWNVQS